jgi:hypothetical protein
MCTSAPLSCYLSMIKLMRPFVIDSQINPNPLQINLSSNKTILVTLEWEHNDVSPYDI